MKPVLRTRMSFDFQECTSWVEKKLGYNTRDVLNSHSHYWDWCKSIGEDHTVGDQQLWNRYLDHPEGDCNCPEYLDHWHFLESNLEGLSNKSEVDIGSWLLACGNEWQNKITQSYIDEFGDDATYWIEW